ncbi:FkbM family methyltransferase [Micromonospora sp. NBC_01699]|uniref:FkbM family methyltransferase n=1 Tax=Micromonospora sp. NBC_01699 TaxID=2975984 RepID=UPI002E28593D|nr:FkbM family methyltransferase [Micromonospora sp. NBC_01699]
MPGLDRSTLTHIVTNLVARHTRFLDNELPTMRTLVKRGDVCVDVGSAAGVYTQALSQLVGPAGLVHSVEPLSFSHPLWSRLLAAKTRPNVRYYPVAMGAEPGRVAMRVPFGPGGAATSRSFLDWRSQGVGSNDEFTHHADVMVDVTTLDELAAEVGLTRLDFLKIDVEGGELHVLHGGERTIEKYLPTMYIEIEARHTARYEYGPDDIVTWLRERGYTMYLWRNGWHATERVCAHTNNYVFRVPPR